MAEPPGKKYKSSHGLYCMCSLPLVPRQIHADCVSRTGTAKSEGGDSDKLAFTLGAMDMPDPFEKDVPMHGDLEEALKWMAKVRCSEASNPCIQYG